MKNKLILSMLLGIFLISFISAVECDGTNLGTYKQGQHINLRQVCNDCTYVTLSSITYPDSIISNLNENMTKSGIDFNFLFNDTIQLGDYQYSVYGDSGGLVSSEVFCFNITPSGQNGSNNIVFIIFVIIFIYGLTLLGFFKENFVITIMGGMFMLFLGVYIINNGVIVYRDDLTRYLAYMTIGFGAFFSLVGGNWMYNDL